MKLVFFGSGAFGLPTLMSLARSHTLSAVITQPDKPAGRGGGLTPTPVGAHAASQLPGVPLLKPERINDPGVVAEVRALKADAWVVIAIGQKLGRELLEGIFAVNLHASLLPRWRGAAPINAAVLAGDSVTGNSVITLANRMDAGLILGQSRREVDPRSTAGELHDLLAADGPALVESVLSEFSRGTLPRTPQDESRVTMAPKLAKADGWVDFAESAEACRRRIHGLTPWPGVTVAFRGQPLKLSRVQVVPGSSDQAPGSIVDSDQGHIACGDSLMKILEVHPAGRKNMPWPDFARGQRVRTGELLVGRRPSPTPPSSTPETA